MRHVLDELARTSLRNSAVRPRKATSNEDTVQASILRTGMMGHYYDPCVSPQDSVPAQVYAPSKATYGREAGEAGRQQLHRQKEMRQQQWQQVQAPLRRRYRVIIDGSNVLKHGGGKGRVANMIGLVAAVEESLKVTSSEILVILDHWVAKEIGAAALAQLKSADYTLRVARTHVTADVRVQQAAYALRAYVVTNDRYLNYCPWHKYSTSSAGDASEVEVAIGEARTGEQARPGGRQAAGTHDGALAASLALVSSNEVLLPCLFARVSL